MNKVERIKLVKAMEYIARQVNDEEVFEGWLANGVADGDVEDGDLAVNADDADILDYYIEDDNFAYIMSLFLQIMSGAKKSGGLYCDDVVSE